MHPNVERRGSTQPSEAPANPSQGTDAMRLSPLSPRCFSYTEKTTANGSEFSRRTIGLREIA